MDMNKDARLTFDEFKEGSKQDPTIVQVSGVQLTHTSDLSRPGAGALVARGAASPVWPDTTPPTPPYFFDIPTPLDPCSSS